MRTLIIPLTVLLATPAWARAYSDSAACAAMLTSVRTSDGSHDQLLRLSETTARAFADASDGIKTRVRRMFEKPNFESHDEFSFTRILTGEDAAAAYVAEVTTEALRADQRRRPSLRAYVSPFVLGSLNSALGAYVFYQTAKIPLVTDILNHSATPATAIMATAGYYAAFLLMDHALGHLRRLDEVYTKRTYPNLSDDGRDLRIETPAFDELITRVVGAPGDVQHVTAKAINANRLLKYVDDPDAREALKTISRNGDWIQLFTHEPLGDLVNLDFSFLGITDPETQVPQLIVNVHGVRLPSR